MNTPNDIPDQTIGPNGEPVEKQPQWRREYPIDTDRETEQNRRQFLKTLAIASGAATCGQVALLAAQSPVSAGRWESAGIFVLDKKFGDLKDGESVLFHYPDKHSPCLFVRTSKHTNGWVAYSQKCTHLMCPVVPEPEKDRLFCPCHNGAFELATGDPLFGPPQRPLPKVKIQIDALDGTIKATGMEATL